jgi:hypothetical protein
MYGSAAEARSAELVVSEEVAAAGSEEGRLLFTIGRRHTRPTYRLRFAIVIATVALGCLVMGVAQIGPPRSGWDWFEIVVYGALTVAAMAEGWWRVRHHFPLFPRRPSDD